ncbi:MAG: hypothetical protein GXP54_03225 [Deltaproteobacteria bacterium]|nr:hypothetical protein [Deltaproteobacteria bacterium]
MNDSAEGQAVDMSFLLKDTEIESLRKGYNAEVMKAASKGGIAQVYPPGAPFPEGVVDWLYEGTPIAPRDRERCLIALLAQRQDGVMLAIHIYWGLMEGLGLDEIGRTLLLSGAYTGIPNYTAGLFTLKKTCAALKGVVAAGDAQSPTVLGGLLKEFNV